MGLFPGEFSVVFSLVFSKVGLCLSGEQMSEGGPVVVVVVEDPVLRSSLSYKLGNVARLELSMEETGCCASLLADGICRIIAGQFFLKLATCDEEQ